MFDGQGQILNIDIGSVDIIEVLCGFFFVLYGNLFGGVINVISQIGIQLFIVEVSSYYGSFGIWYYGMKVIGVVGDGSYVGDVDYMVLINCFIIYGYCDYSGVCKNLVNVWLGVCINDVSKLILLLNSVDIKVNDVGGLIVDEWCDNLCQLLCGDQYNICKNI